MRSDPRRIERVEGGEPGVGIAAFGKDDGAADLRADAIGMGDEEVIERAQGGEVEAARDRTLDMDGLDRRFALIAAKAGGAGGIGQKTFGFDDEVAIPQAAVLMFQGHEGPSGIPARGAASGAIEHEGEKPLRFGFLWQERDEEAGKPDRLARQGIGGVGGVEPVPALGEGGVNGIKHLGQTFGQIGGFGQGKAQTRVANAGLGADKALRHGGGFGEEGAGDARRIKAEDGLQHQGRAGRRVDGGMGADKHEAKAFVGERCVFGQEEVQEKVGFGFLAVGSGACGVLLPVARGGEKPCVGIGRDAVARPMIQRRKKGVRQRILGGCDIAVGCRKDRDEPAIAGARRLFGGAFCGIRLRRHVPGAGMGGRTGRSSTEADSAEGARAAQSNAVSRSGTSITK